jgi:glyceraldehyde-3-phosphate dehydrogenase/erythrose-4-phosphate dehydrogenase
VKGWDAKIMKNKIAINGFGRIGRMVFRHIMENDNNMEACRGQ